MGQNLKSTYMFSLFFSFFNTYTYNILHIQNFVSKIMGIQLNTLESILGPSLYGVVWEQRIMLLWLNGNVLPKIYRWLLLYLVLKVELFYLFKRRES